MTSKACYFLDPPGLGLDRRLEKKYEEETTSHLLTLSGGS
jgi:hypothetical protein